MEEQECKNKNGRTRMEEQEWKNKNGRTRIEEQEWKNKYGRTRMEQIVYRLSKCLQREYVYVQSLHISQEGVLHTDDHLLDSR